MTLPLIEVNVCGDSFSMRLVTSTKLFCLPAFFHEYALRTCGPSLCCCLIPPSSVFGLRCFSCLGSLAALKLISMVSSSLMISATLVPLSGVFAFRRFVSAGRIMLVHMCRVRCHGRSHDDMRLPGLVANSPFQVVFGRPEHLLGYKTPNCFHVQFIWSFICGCIFAVSDV